eukprot:1137817-Pelagomonas_calceolata.AAC.1
MRDPPSAGAGVANESQASAQPPAAFGSIKPPSPARGFIKPAFEHPSPLFCPSRDWPILAEQGESPTAL